MLRLLLISFVLGGSLLFILKTLYDFWSGLAGTRSAIQRDYVMLKELVEDYELTPWLHDEIDLISRMAEVHSKMEVVAHTQYGVYFSIYQEPMMAFAVKEYKNNNKRVIYMRYNDKEYNMLFQNGEVSIMRGKDKIGKVNLEKGVQLSLEGQKVFIDSHSNAGLVPVDLNNKYTMSVIAHTDEDKDQSRVLKKVEVHTEEEGQLLLMTVAYALIDQHI